MIKVLINALPGDLFEKVVDEAAMPDWYKQKP